MDRETADEIKRHFNVVAEGLRSEIRTVAEGSQGFREEVPAEFKAVRDELSETTGAICAGWAGAHSRVRPPLTRWS